MTTLSVSPRLEIHTTTKGKNMRTRGSLTFYQFSELDARAQESVLEWLENDDKERGEVTNPHSLEYLGDGTIF